MSEGIFYGVIVIVTLAAAYVAYLEIEAELKRFLAEREARRQADDPEMAARAEIETDKG